MATSSPIEAGVARVAPNQMLSDSEGGKANGSQRPVVTIVDDEDIPSNSGEPFRLIGHSDAFF